LLIVAANALLHQLVHETHEILSLSPKHTSKVERLTFEGTSQRSGQTERQDRGDGSARTEADECHIDRHTEEDQAEKYHETLNINAVLSKDNVDVRDVAFQGFNFATQVVVHVLEKIGTLLILVAGHLGVGGLVVHGLSLVKYVRHPSEVVLVRSGVVLHSV
jgi:hypothetical protein